MSKANFDVLLNIIKIKIEKKTPIFKKQYRQNFSKQLHSGMMRNTIFKLHYT